MIKIEINEDQLKELMKETFKKNVLKTLEDRDLEYWVRNEVHKVLSKDLFDKMIKPMLTPERIKKMMQEAFNNYIYERFSD